MKGKEREEIKVQDNGRNASEREEAER